MTFPDNEQSLFDSLERDMTTDLDAWRVSMAAYFDHAFSTAVKVIGAHRKKPIDLGNAKDLELVAGHVLKLILDKWDTHPNAPNVGDILQLQGPAIIQLQKPGESIMQPEAYTKKVNIVGELAKFDIQGYVDASLLDHLFDEKIDPSVYMRAAGPQLVLVNTTVTGQEVDGPISFPDRKVYIPLLSPGTQLSRLEAA